VRVVTAPIVAAQKADREVEETAGTVVMEVVAALAETVETGALAERVDT